MLILLFASFCLPHVKAESEITLICGSTANDGYMWTYGPTYEDVWNSTASFVTDIAETIDMGQKYDGNYVIMRGVVVFNTSTIPDDAIIDSAILSIAIEFDYSAVEFNLTVQDGLPSYPHIPLIDTDFNRLNYDGNHGSVSSVGITTWEYTNVTLTQSGLEHINVTDLTRFCIRTDRDIEGSSSQQDEFFVLFSHEYTALAPFLEVIYHLPPEPTPTPTATPTGDYTINDAVAIGALGFILALAALAYAATKR